jgi:hypothetical protein
MKTLTKTVVLTAAQVNALDATDVNDYPSLCSRISNQT